MHVIDPSFGGIVVQNHFWFIFLTIRIICSVNRRQQGYNAIPFWNIRANAHFPIVAEPKLG